MAEIGGYPKAVSRVVRWLAQLGDRALGALYPPLCLACGEIVVDEGGLCPSCWRETPFIFGLACDRCGQPVPGYPEEAPVLCDECVRHPPPWRRGRAVFVYGGVARRLVLALKYGDALHLARPAGRWMAQKAAALISDNTLIAPVPLHRWRLFHRRYNQAAVLAKALAAEVQRPFVPDLLQRVRATPPLEGRSRAERAALVANTIRPHPRQGARIAGCSILLVDDVMTSGATLAACAEACWDAGAAQVDVVVLARAAREELS